MCGDNTRRLMEIAHLMCNDPESISPKLRPASSEEEKGKVAFCAVRARERMERNVMAGTVPASTTFIYGL